MAGDAILREVSITIPMRPDVEIEAGQTAAALAESMHMSADKIDEVRMAVMEACINAFQHSHSPDHEVRITVAVLGKEEPQRLLVTVHDNGVGFNPDDVEEPTIEAKLKAESKRGWGLKIIRGLMDEVEIESGTEGTTVVMSKSR
jgi:serine/threonine-protein kinase RsbW